jgi:aryl-alcohol dehydrogenase-like predicted oxidoreductase
MTTTTMRPLGQSKVQVTPVIFGAWAVGGWMWGGSDEADAIEAIRASVANGVTTIDTAAIYGMGYSEEVVAKAVKGKRDKVVIATKCGMRWDGPAGQGSDPWATNDNDGNPVTVMKNARAESIAFECEQSLKRLRTDYIDVYQIHWPDVSTKVEESMDAMAKLRKQGKVRAIGVSNYDVDWMRNAQARLQANGEVLASLQPPYSVMRRGIEEKTLPFCREQKIGVIVYSPLERGLLTGVVGPDRKFPAGDHRADHPYFSAENRKRVAAALEKIRPICERHKASFAQAIINWTFNEPGITAALVGARNAKQAEHNAKAMSFALTVPERGFIRAAFDELSRVASK